MDHSPSALLRPAGSRLHLGRAWLWLALAALIGAGILALLLVLSRTPGIQDVFPLKDFFRAALIVHVDLSVLVWFMAFGGLLWSLSSTDRCLVLGWAGFWFAVGGTVLIVISPFFPDSHPLLNNYIPVLQHPVFFAGLWLACGGFVLTLVRTLFTAFPPKPFGNAEGALRLGIFLSAAIGILAMSGFVTSWLHHPEFLEGQALFELVFWGGGHTLQFQHALLMAVAWLILLDALDAPARVSPWMLASLFILAAAPVAAMPVLYALYPVGSPGHVAGFARLMEAGHPLMLPLIALVILALPRVLRSPASPARSALLASLLLFLVGGVLAYMIRGVNVVIPAHYHGSIVGVTLAFMGLAYVLLPRFGYGTVKGKMACWQPYIYGGGQLLHVLGLAWSGGYGVQRKVAGADQMLTTLPQKIGMGMMGLGGLIAIIGGILFVVICLRAMSRKSA
ncbi:MAG: cbb3-type cytochrome c oxidase subunit I [Proteobacteria bacterium]|nr:cbb3-type cytochrome c oxidase subunit I [Pseudomonadota bacterium]HQR03899.1 cbb3-type cytochrome c oxidase subunit I [Rhodocyclaceae bacterium]